MKRILIVDDEPITRIDLGDMLSELGYQVIGEAADGFDAVEECRKKTPDVVLMDVKMPIFDGLAAAKTILTENIAGCVVLLTAFSDQDIIRRACEAGITGYVTKPIDDQRSLVPTIELAYARQQELREVKLRADCAERRILEDREIHKAQKLLAETQGCSTDEAYQQMRKAAMNKRISVVSVAEGILRQCTTNSDIDMVKEYLMRERGISEEAAYHHIVLYSKEHHLSVNEGASYLKAILTKKGKLSC